jgi:hypothetical protein
VRRALNVAQQPVLAQYGARDLDDDVVDGSARVVVEA